MPYQSVRDPGFARGFKNLANILSPDPSAEIKADYMGRQANLVDARTNEVNADVAKKNYAQQKLQDLGNILASNPDFADQAVRARLAGTMSGVDGGLQHGPRSLVGNQAFIQPGAVNPDDFANQLVGAGVQAYGGTEAGVQQKLATDRDMSDRKLDMGLLMKGMELDQETWADQQPGQGRAPATVSANTLEDIGELLVGQLPEGVDRETLGTANEQELVARAARRFQTSKNIQDAVAQVMGSIQVGQTPDKPWELFSPSTWGDNSETNVTLAPEVAPAAGGAAPVNPGVAPGLVRSKITGKLGYRQADGSVIPMPE